MWWLIKIVILFLLFSFNAVYKFLPEKLIKNHPYIKKIAIFIAIVLVAQFIVTEIRAYINYSYALIAEDGTVIGRKNFSYEVKTIDPPAYIIVGLSNPKNLTLQPYKAVSSSVTDIKEGTKIEFVFTGWGNPAVYSKFKIELRK